MTAATDAPARHRPPRARGAVTLTAARLLRIELRRSAMPWILPVIAALFWFDSYRFATGTPPYWVLRTFWNMGQGRTFMDFAPFVAGAAAWIGSRDGRRGTADLVAGAVRARWAAQLAAWAAAAIRPAGSPAGRRLAAAGVAVPAQPPQPGRPRCWRGPAPLLWAALHWQWNVAGGPAAQDLIPLTIETGAAAVIAVTTHCPFGDPEGATGRWLPWLRLAAAVALTALAFGALAAGAAPVPHRAGPGSRRARPHALPLPHPPGAWTA
jgi:hypothetical protein